MTITNTKSGPWMAKTVRSHAGAAIWEGFIPESDQDAIATCIEHYRQYRIYRPVAAYTLPQASSNHIRPFYFTIACPDLELLHVRTLKACHYLNHKYLIPTDCIELICHGDGQIHIIIAPVVARLPSDDVIQWVNYKLTHELFKECTTVIDIDNPAAGNYVISVSFDELLHLNKKTLRNFCRMQEELKWKIAKEHKEKCLMI